MEIVELEQNDNVFSVFRYRDATGSPAFYMSLGHQYEYAALFPDEAGEISFTHYDEVCLEMGATADDALEFLNRLILFADEEPGVSMEFKARHTNAGEKLTEATVVTGVVNKQLLGRSIDFTFRTDKYAATASIGKNGLKSLRASFKITRKIRPKDFE